MIAHFYEHLLEMLSSCPTTHCLWIAYSGGLDSHVLLHLLTQRHFFNSLFERGCGCVEREKNCVRAIHIHHGLNPQADNWANHCQQTCETLEIPCEIIRINVSTAPRESLEANARIARYQAITQLIAPNDVVLTAQHADDQAETVLLQLLRGAGVAGLAAMPAVSRLSQGWLVRPLLKYTRAQLYDYAQKSDLHWIEDSSNADTRFDRNFLRHDIVPPLQKRWPSISQTLSRVARHQAEADELIQILAEEDLQICQGDNPDQLLLTVLSQFNPARQRNVLRFWIKKLGLPLPSTVQLQHILSDILTAKADRQPLVHWQGGETRRYRNLIFAMPNLPPTPKASDTFTWTLPQTLYSHPEKVDPKIFEVCQTSKVLPLGKLAINEMQGQGVALPANTQLQVRFRQGGETFYWHGHQRAVKKLLQATHILPWQRPFIPLIYVENRLVAIPKIGIADGFEATDKQVGWEIRWIL